MQQTMAAIGSIPHRGITHVRIHYLLELVKLRGPRGGALDPDWTDLDTALDVLVRNRLRPFFELMGNPSGYFTSFLEDDQVRAWRVFVRELSLHVIDRYGAEEVRSWYFESWNEPDAGWFDGGPEAFLNYYDACSEGLSDADPRLVFGGPGTSATLSSPFLGLLDHCVNGSNYFTGEKGVRIDFVSVHEKGAPPSPEDLTPDSAAICRREIGTIEYIRSHFPGLAAKPFMNNECDPQVGWSDFHTWHARPYYASLVIRIIHQHLIGIIDPGLCTYRLLSNDNGFLGRWGNRSLLACLGGELDLGYDSREFLGQPDPLASILPRGEFSLVRKPVFQAMAILSLMGDVRCRAECAEIGGAGGEVGAIATLWEDSQAAVLMFNSRDSFTAGGAERIDLRLEGLPFQEAALAHYRIDEEHGDPFAAWEKAGALPEPTVDSVRAMREKEGLAQCDDVRLVVLQDGKLEASFELPMPGVSLVLLSRKPESPPGTVRGLRAERYRGTGGTVDVMLLWQCPDPRFVRTYEVLAEDGGDETFSRLNTVDILCASFLHSWDSSRTRWRYRVRAVDFWGRAGEESTTIEVREV
jgi:L-iduronidase